MSLKLFPKANKNIAVHMVLQGFSKEGLHTTRISTMMLLGRDYIFLFSNIFNPLKYCRINLSSSFPSCSITGACLLVCTLPLQSVSAQWINLTAMSHKFESRRPLLMEIQRFFYLRGLAYLLITWKSITCYRCETSQGCVYRNTFR